MLNAAKLVPHSLPTIDTAPMTVTSDSALTGLRQASH
jgi:hypothetical protein